MPLSLDAGQTRNYTLLARFILALKDYRVSEHISQINLVFMKLNETNVKKGGKKKFSGKPFSLAATIPVTSSGDKPLYFKAESSVEISTKKALLTTRSFRFTLVCKNPKDRNLPIDPKLGPVIRLIFAFNTTLYKRASTTYTDLRTCDQSASPRFYRK